MLRVPQEAFGLLDAETRQQIKANPEAFNVMAASVLGAAANVRAVARQLPKEPALEDDVPDFEPVDYPAIARRPQEQAQVRRSWLDTQRFLV